MVVGVPAPVLAARAPTRAGPWAAAARQAPGCAGLGRRHLAGPPPAPGAAAAAGRAQWLGAGDK